MKQGESDFNILGLKRNTITPSTAYSFSETPEIIQSKSDALTRNLALMQNQLALKLNQQAKYIGLKIPVLHNRNDLADLNLQKIRKNKEIISAVMEKLQKISYWPPSAEIVDLEVVDQENKKELKAVVEIQKEIKEMIKKIKNFKKLERKEIHLNEKIIFFHNKIEKIKQFKKELLENLSDIEKGQNKVVDIIMLSKIKLESIIDSKEDLMKCLPQIQRPSSKLESLKVEINELKSINFELHRLFLSHESELNDLLIKNKNKLLDYNKYLSNFHSREVLMKVQARYLEEKKARIDLARKELGLLEKSIYKFISNSPKPNHFINPVLKSRTKQ